MRGKVGLLDHQKHALYWMLWREDCDPPGGLLADDMGLGKTLTTIALILRSRELERKKRKTTKKKTPERTLVVCPAHLVHQWYQEIVMKGCIPEVTIYGKEKPGKSVLEEFLVVLTSYEILMKDYKSRRVLFDIRWERVVLDEAHCVRNSDAVKSRVVTKLKTEKRWALTGTPIHNGVKDIFSILRFLKLEPFHELKNFERWINNDERTGMERLQSILECLMLRRTKEGLVAGGRISALPLKTNRTVSVVLSNEERLVHDRVVIFSTTFVKLFLHEKREKEKEKALGADYVRSEDFSSYELSKRQEEFLRRRTGGVKDYHILTLILRLRQCCCHPALIEDMLDKHDFVAAGVEELQKRVLEEANRSILDELAEFEGDDDDYERPIEKDKRLENRYIFSRKNRLFDEDRASSKIKRVLEEVKEIIKKNEKVVIVSDWVRYLEMMPETRGKIGFFTGKQISEERQKIVDAFNEEGDMMILMLSLKAGGLGLNLMGANHVMLVDIHWNPQLEVQAEDRVYRIGQKRNVIIYWFIVENSIEERIVELQEKKVRMAEDIFSGLGQDNGINNLQENEIRSLFEL